MLINKSRILNQLSQSSMELINDLEIYKCITSTNDILKSKEQLLVHDKISICLAEEQTHGRGQYGRTWFSPFGKNIYLSIAFFTKKNILMSNSGNFIREEIEKKTNSEENIMPVVINTNTYFNLRLELLNEIITNKIIDTLVKNVSLEFNKLTIKKPNDILWNNKKLVGILIEFNEHKNLCVIEKKYFYIIIGIGINVNMSKFDLDQLSYNETFNFVSLKDIVGYELDRDKLVAALINSFVPELKLWF